MGDALEAIVELVRSDFEAYLATGPTLALRDQHSREDFSYKGQLHVLDVPEDFRHGLFATVATYDVVVRFSPNSALPTPRDAHGMAIKVYADGQEQDLLLANSEVFMARNEEDVLALMQARHANTNRALGRYFFPSAQPREWRVRPLLNTIGMVGRQIHDPLRIRYYSATAMCCGPSAVRVSARPKVGGFDIFLQDCPAEMVDDPTRRCREPWSRVADLRLVERIANTEDLSFGVHHHLPEHAPLGQVAGVRAVVYPMIASMRREYNRAHGQDP